MRVLTFVVTCDYIDFWTLCFAHHFVYCCHFRRFLINFFACLYLTTMQILWAQKYEYGVFFITHAREIFKSLVFDSWIKNFSSICDEQNTILTFPPHSIYTRLKIWVSHPKMVFDIPGFQTPTWKQPVLVYFNRPIYLQLIFDII